MNPAEGLFLYTPVPYWVAFVLLLYRHDLPRLRHPVRDDGGPRAWWRVLNHLGLLSSEQAAKKPGRKAQFVPYLICVAVSLVASLSWSLRIFGSAWYYLIIAQGIAAIILTAATTRYLGPPPRRPYVDTLRYPRLGSRLRHLGKIPEQKREGEPGAEPEVHQDGTHTVEENAREGAN